MKLLSKREKQIVANLLLIADAIEYGWTVEENDGVHSEWKVIDIHRDFSICSFYAYRIAERPIEGELADKIREFFRIAFAPPIGCAPVSANVKEILVGLGLAKGGEPCE